MSCPVSLACGEMREGIGSDLFDLLVQRLTRGLRQALSGLGHFGSLEDPDAVTASVAQAHDRWQEPPA